MAPRWKASLSPQLASRENSQESQKSIYTAPETKGIPIYNRMLASYPRSGNPLLRLPLRNGFGFETYSLDNEGDDRDFGPDE